MTIEQAIRQKKFNNEYEKAVVNIMYTASWLDDLTLKALKPYAISPQQYNVLRILRGASPGVVRLADITERMIDKNSNATRLVEKLRQKNYLKRDVCPSNRRQVDIGITQKGLDILSEIDEITKTWIDPLRALSKPEAVTLNNLLDKLRGGDEK